MISHLQDHGHGFSAHQQMHYPNHEAFNYYPINSAAQSNEYSVAATYQYATSADTQAACKFND